MVNQAEGAHRAIVAAITEAAQEREAIVAEVVQLQTHLQQRQERAMQLEQFIAVGQRLCGDAPAGLPSGGPRAGAGQGRQPLTTAILEIISAAERPLTPAEVRTALVHRGQAPTKNVVASTLSTLVKRQRLTRPAPGHYTVRRQR
jgi:hypothetical protein